MTGKQKTPVWASFFGAIKQQVMNKVLFLKILYVKFLEISAEVYKVLKFNGIICLKLQMTYFKDAVK